MKVYSQTTVCGMDGLLNYYITRVLDDYYSIYILILINTIHLNFKQVKIAIQPQSFFILNLSDNEDYLKIDKTFIHN